MNTPRLTGEIYLSLIKNGAAHLRRNAAEINDLNVFPIPDGDTGDNMLLTMNGGASSKSENSSLSNVSSSVASGMLLGARGNSGVILSQFFAGIADCFKNIDDASVDEVKKAFQGGVERAYKAVVQPVEGTILTVARESVNCACKTNSQCLEDFFIVLIKAAQESLEKTPEKLEILARSGVVDSGGAGLLSIFKGMYNFLAGEKEEEDNWGNIQTSGNSTAINPDLFTEDSVLEFGYCTELLLRLQKCKVNDTSSFDVSVISKFLSENGNSVVCIKTGSIVKLHVHTMQPYVILEFCQRFGEFITVKIENMMVQHNEVIQHDNFATNNKTKQNVRKKFASVAVASGSGITDLFKDFGVDYVIDGGQTNNPSSQNFIDAFDSVNADTIFVLPNNGNVILAAKQAADIYKSSDVRIIPAKTIGDGYAVLSMLDFNSQNADEIEEAMIESMDGVATVEISQAVRDASNVKKGDYIGISGKNIISCDSDRLSCTVDALESVDIDSHSIIVILRGKDVPEAECSNLEKMLEKEHPFVEVHSAFGNQDIYDYILVVE